MHFLTSKLYQHVARSFHCYQHFCLVDLRIKVKESSRQSQFWKWLAKVNLWWWMAWVVFFGKRSGNLSIMEENATVSDNNGMDCKMLKWKCLGFPHKPDLTEYLFFKTGWNGYSRVLWIPAKNSHILQTSNWNFHMFGFYYVTQTTIWYFPRHTFQDWQWNARVCKFIMHSISSSPWLVVRTFQFSLLIC